MLFKIVTGHEGNGHNIPSTITTPKYATAAPSRHRLDSACHMTAKLFAFTTLALHYNRTSIGAAPDQARKI
jgi:hypothetical protein